MSAQGLWQRLNRHWPWRPSAATTRWVVVDVETSGLDTQRDRLLAIAAIALQASDARPPALVLEDSFEVVLRQDDAAANASSKSNILLHGIGIGAQTQGISPKLALRAFADWLQAAPLLAYHSAFDQAMISRDLHQVLGLQLRNPWVDLAAVATALYPHAPPRSLDDWLSHFGVVCARRHQAAADVLATAQLLQRLWPQVRAHAPNPGYADLRRLARQHRWLR